MEILAKKLPYIKLEPKYREWKAQEDLRDAKRHYYTQNADTNTKAVLYRQKQAKAVAQNILMLDNYVYNKAEDVEAVFTTVNMQLLAGVAALTAIPQTVTKVIPVLEKHGKAVKLNNLLKNYEKSAVKIGKNVFPLPKLLTVGMAALSAIIYAHGVTKSTIAQLSATRRAKFEGLTDKFNADADYAVLTPIQEREIEKKLQDINNPINKESEIKIPFLKKLFKRVDIKGSLSQTRKLIEKNTEYKLSKAEFEKKLNNSPIKSTKANKQMLRDMINYVDLQSEDELERMEKIVNVGYSSLFVGGFLEYLISDKLIDILHIKTPIIKSSAKLLLPLATYLILNKNIAGVQNNAIKATRYKNLKNFVENKENFVEVPEKLNNKAQPQKQENKVGLFKFLKGMLKDIKDYRAFEENELTMLNKKHELKKSIQLSPEQRKEAKVLKLNTQYTIHKESDNRKYFAQGVEAISEIALAPFEIASTAVGAFLGSKAGAHCKNGAMKKFYMALGAIIAFIPTAIVEIKTTAEQKKALRIASMRTIEDIDSSDMFKNVN